MAKFDLKAMDMDSLLEARAEVERELRERAKDLQRQLALLGGVEVSRRGRPVASAGHESALKGRAVPPKYRGPEGETWAGRGAMPRWLSALIKEGHSVDEFLIGAGGGRKAAASKNKAPKKKVTKPTRKPRQPKEAKTETEPVAA